MNLNEILEDLKCEEIVEKFPSGIDGYASCILCDHANENPRGVCKCFKKCYCRRSNGMCPGGEK